MGNKITRKCLNVDERYTRPQGLYPQYNVDRKKIRRLIINSKLAPCFPGEEEINADFEECPICFLYYPSLNRSNCCSKGVCTECFLQMKSLCVARSTQCPFCKFRNYTVEYRGRKTIEEKDMEVAEEQKFIEAKIRMHKQELLDSKECEQYKEEGHITPKTSNVEFTTRHSPKLSKSQSRQTIHIQMPQQVKFTFDIEKWKQNLYESNYCYDEQWLYQPYRPSLSDGSSSFRTCGLYCEPNCSKCLMTFYKRRVYNELDVITPKPRALKDNKIKPFMGRWRPTWGNHQFPLSQSFPLPSRMPKYHYHLTKILKPKTFEHLLHNVPSHLDGTFVCEDPKAQNASNITQEFITPNISNKFSSSDDMDSSWIYEDYGSEGSLASISTPQQDEQATTPLSPSSQACKDMKFTMLLHQTKSKTKSTSLNNTWHRDDDFDFDLEDFMVMEAIWQSIQDQGMCYNCSGSEYLQMKPNQRIDLNTKFQVDDGLQEISKDQCQLVGLRGNDQDHYQKNKKLGGLASAIAALAERHVIKKEATYVAQNYSNKVFFCECEPVDKVGEFRSHPHNIMNIENGDSRFVPKDAVYKKCNKNEIYRNNDLHTSAMTITTKSSSKDYLDISSIDHQHRKFFVDSCQNDKCFQQIEDGASTSTHSVHLDKVVCVEPTNSPIVRINRCAHDSSGQLMLPKSFEEQMMLAMALSITDAH